MIVLLVMTSVVSIYQHQMVYLVQIVFIVIIFVSIPLYIFNDIFCVNNITNIFDNNFYITGLLNKDNKFLYCNYKVTRESITLFLQENKFKVYKIFKTSESNSVFLMIIFIILRFFSRKLNKCLSLCYFSVFWFSIVSLKF